MKKLLSVQEVANILDVTTVTIQTYCRKGILRAIPLDGLWKIDEEDLLQFIMERKSSFLKADPLYGVPLSDEEQRIVNEKINAAETFEEKVEIFASVAHRRIQKPAVMADFDVPVPYCPSPEEFAELSAIEDDEERAKRYKKIVASKSK